MMQETIIQIIEREKEITTISTLYKSQEENAYYCRYMAYFIQMLNESFNIDKGITPMQSEIIIHGTHTKFPWFRINDVFKVVQGFMMGKYKIYNRIDPPTWFEACTLYDVKRSEIQSEYLEKKHHNSKFEEKELIIIPAKKDKKTDYREAMRSAMDKFKFDRELKKQSEENEQQ
jgi:hypothetical protein